MCFLFILSSRQHEKAQQNLGDNDAICHDDSDDDDNAGRIHFSQRHLQSFVTFHNIAFIVDYTVIPLYHNTRNPRCHAVLKTPFT